MLLRRRSVWAALFVVDSPLLPQTADHSNAATPTFRTNVNVILVDVVVTGHNGEPITGLQREDFPVVEQGKPQTIASFEEHKGAPSNASGMPPLPPYE